MMRSTEVAEVLPDEGFAPIIRQGIHEDATDARTDPGHEHMEANPPHRGRGNKREREPQGTAPDDADAEGDSLKDGHAPPGARFGAEHDGLKVPLRGHVRYPSR